MMRDGGPALFGHMRVGSDGRTFRCWKLRSPVPDAETLQRDHPARDPAAQAEWEANFKLDKAPRITPSRNFLLRSNLDELLQLWRILRGEMSIVGSHPVASVELQRYGAHVKDYYAFRPSLTGLWQVSGCKEASWMSTTPGAASLHCPSSRAYLSLYPIRSRNA